MRLYNAAILLEGNFDEPFQLLCPYFTLIALVTSSGLVYRVCVTG